MDIMRATQQWFDGQVGPHSRKKLAVKNYTSQVTFLTKIRQKQSA
jgi:hypothetical protein